MRKPCAEDLRDAAEALRKCPVGDGAASRVALWLDSQILGSDRQQARKLGCSVKYLRWMREQEGLS